MKKSVLMLLCAILGSVSLLADVSETIFVPKSDFSSGAIHFYHQGDTAEKYGFLFDKGFEQKRIVYAQPEGYTLKTLSDGKLKLLFDKTDHYSYLQQAQREDFVLSQEGDLIKILISGGDCVGKVDCVTKMNILTAIVPKGYSVLSYKGLDQDLKELKEKEWKIQGDIYTLMAPNVKGACLYLEVKKGSIIAQQSVKIKANDAVPSTLVYANTELFEKGDVALSSQGKERLKSLLAKLGGSGTIQIHVFQDKVPPVRLAARYPSAQKFSQARADGIVKEVVKQGLSEKRVRIDVIAKENEKTRVEAVIIPAQ